MIRLIRSSGFFGSLSGVGAAWSNAVLSFCRLLAPKRNAVLGLVAAIVLLATLSAVNFAYGQGMFSQGDFTLMVAQSSAADQNSPISQALAHLNFNRESAPKASDSTAGGAKDARAPADTAKDGSETIGQTGDQRAESPATASNNAPVAPNGGNPDAAVARPPLSARADRTDPPSAAAAQPAVVATPSAAAVNGAGANGDGGNNAAGNGTVANGAGGSGATGNGAIANGAVSNSGAGNGSTSNSAGASSLANNSASTAGAGSGDSKSDGAGSAASSASPTSLEQQLSPEERFIAAVADAARMSQRETGVPASVTIAQAMLESDLGRSKLCRDGNNYFGIKATAKLGPAGVVYEDTREVVNGKNITIKAAFRAYNNMLESFVDHAHFFLESNRYAAAMASVSNPQEFARQIQKAGYATDPNYAKALIQLMDKFNLYAFD